MTQKPVTIPSKFIEGAWAATVLRFDVEGAFVSETHRKPNMIIDTGSLDVCLETSMWQAVLELIRKHCDKSGCKDMLVSLVQGCVAMETVSLHLFPTVTLHFQTEGTSEALAPLKAADYLPTHGCELGYIRLGITNCGDSISRLGLVGMAPFTWSFDSDNHEISFGPTGNCLFDEKCANQTTPTPTPTYDALYPVELTVTWPWFVWVLVAVSAVGMGAIGSMSLFHMKHTQKASMKTASELERALMGGWPNS
eukprot:c9668_g1_i2.p1 GENE.c9668_g1_i2~~c9668_g1_i2.p1  ORF type:complete len:252 (+),score=47.78 c9668_g1_i2:723-1478(+)